MPQQAPAHSLLDADDLRLGHGLQSIQPKLDVITRAFDATQRQERLVPRARHLGACLFVLPTAPHGKITAQQWFAAASVVAFAWAKLGRLGWTDQSFKGETIYEELDSFIFWVLYWVGTISGMVAMATAAV